MKPDLFEQAEQLNDTACPQCQQPMIPIHGHYECRGPNGCGWRDGCCDGGEQC